MGKGAYKMFEEDNDTLWSFLGPQSKSCSQKTATLYLKSFK